MHSFWIDCTAFIALLLLHSYVTMAPFTDDFSTEEVVLALWFFALFVEELRQGWSLGLKEWWEDQWNRLDGAILVFYVAGVIW